MEEWMLWANVALTLINAALFLFTLLNMGR